MIFLDTETTGLSPGQICQLSYIIDQNGTLEGKNFFLMVDDMPAAASAVHGFTMERLKILSKGQKFKEINHIVVWDIGRNIMLCHNVAFDSSFLRAEMERCGLYINFKSFCTMEYFTHVMKIPGKYGFKWPRLSELLDFLQIDHCKVLQFAKEIYNSEDISFHDARFDTAGLYLAWKEAKLLGYKLP